MTVFVIGLGSNLGKRSANLAQGASRLRALPGLHVSALSRVFESDAVGPPQPAYLNAALRVHSTLAARALLEQLWAVEAELGRVRNVHDVHWGPRTLDLDILWAEQPLSSDALQVPHPRLRERAFALAPLLDVAPELGGEYAANLTALGGPPPVYGRLVFDAERVSCECAACTSGANV